MNLCDPAKFYLVLTIITTITYICISYKQNKNNSKKFKKEFNRSILTQVIISILWVILLNWVCNMKKGVTIAWILVFLPFIFWILLLVSIIILFKTI